MRWLVKIKISFIFLALPIFVVGQTSDDYSDLVDDIRPSIVSVQVFDSRGNPQKRGTGFCIGDGLFITNYHVIEGGGRINIRTSSKRDFVVRVESAQPNSDLALLRTESNIETKPLKFVAISPRVGERVLVMGDPLGLTGSVSDGIVSAFRVSGKYGKLIQITAPISEGSSGSPVVNLKGEVVGIATLNLEGGQNLNFAISSTHIQSIWGAKLLSSDSIASRAAKSSTRWRLLVSKDTTYDVETLTKKMNFVSVWIRYDEKDGTSEKALTQIDCLTSRIRTIRSISYLQNGDVQRQNDSEGNWKGIVPDSRGESYLKIFCKDEPDYQYILDWDRRNDLIKKGSAFMDAKEYDAAISAYSELIRGFQESAGYGYAMIGQAKLHQGKFKEATKDLLQAVKLEPDDDYHYHLLGEAYEKQEDYERAKEAYWQALRLDKRFRAAEYDLGRVYEKVNDPRGKLKVYGYLVSQGKVHKYRDIGDLCEKLGLTKEARTYRLSGVGALEQLIRNRKAEILDFLSLASIYKSLGQPVKEKSTLLSGLRFFPNDGSLSQRLADLYNRKKQWNDSIQLIKIVLPLAKDWQRNALLMTLKSAYEGLGNLAEAANVEAQIKKN